jgi:hypothetical protein
METLQKTSEDRVVMVVMDMKSLVPAIKVGDGIEVLSMTRDLHRPNSVVLMLKGEGLPESFRIRPGEMMKSATPTVQKDWDGSVEWRWG